MFTGHQWLIWLLITTLIIVAAFVSVMLGVPVWFVIGVMLLIGGYLHFKNKGTQEGK